MPSPASSSGYAKRTAASSPNAPASTRDLIGSCLGDAFDEIARKRGPFVGVVLEAYRGRLKSYLENLVDAEVSLFPGLAIGPLEEEFELDYPSLEGGVVLRGRVDRISLSEKGVVVVDYKKGHVPSKAQVAPNEDGAIAAAQIPCYLRLVAANGEAIDSAWYVSIEGDARREAGSAVCAFGDDAETAARPVRRDGPYVPRSSLQAFLDSFDSALRATMEGILAGAFPLASKETQKLVCANCGARGICRERYALRFGGGR